MSQEQPITIEYMSLNKLLRAPRNPKEHDLGVIHQSIGRFGYISPILINENTGKIVAGHGRLDTLQSLKVRGKKPPKRIVEKDGEWYVPVIRGVSFENDDEAEAYLLADNRITEIGGWNDALTAQVLSDLAAKGEEMLDGIGFDMEDVDKLLASLAKDDDGDDDDESDREESYEENWMVMVECESEEQQKQVIEELMQQGLKVRALVS